MILPCSPRLGHTFYDGDDIPTTYNSNSITQEGKPGIFPDYDPANLPALRSASERTYIFLRNVSGNTAHAGDVVCLAGGIPCRRFGALGYSTAADDVMGVVDELLPSTGCPNGDMCWVCVNGEQLVKTTRTSGEITAAIAVGDPLYVSTAVTSGATTAGRVRPGYSTFTATQTTDGTANQFGGGAFLRALSAAASTATNTTILAKIRVL